MQKIYFLPLLFVWASTNPLAFAQEAPQFSSRPAVRWGPSKGDRGSQPQKLETSLKQLEKTYRVSFFYQSKLVAGKTTLPSANHKTVEEALDEVLSKTGLTYRKVREGFYAISPKKNKTSFKSGDAEAVPTEVPAAKTSPKGEVATSVGQQKDIPVTGRVLDAKGGPLPGVSISINGTTRGTMTEGDGSFRLSVPEGATLTFSYLGFQKTEVALNGRTTLDVQLTPDQTNLNEVVVLGYSTVEKKDLTGSIATIKAEDLQISGIQSFDQLLTGRATGVMVMQNSGAPGSGATINIRGAQTLTGDNEPLYVIDGVPILKVQQFGENSAASFTPRENPLLALNPNDIASIDILKDASAAGIYGARAANGVIIVTTKRGKFGQKPTLNFNYTHSFQRVANTYDMLNATEFASYLTQLNGPQKPGPGNTNWMDELLEENASIKEANISIRGGSDNAAYALSVSSADQDGLVKKSGLKRYSIRLTVDNKVNERLSFGATANYSHSKTFNAGIDRISNVISFRPDFPIYNENGDYYTGNTPGLNLINPVMQNTRKNEGIARNILANGFMEVKLVEGLKFRTSVNVGELASAQNNFMPKRLRMPLGQAQLFQNDFTSTSLTFDNTLNYLRTFKEIHSVNAVVGASWFNSIDEVTGREYLDFPDDEVLTNPGSANKAMPVSNTKVEGGLNSYFGRVDYGLRDRYLLTLTARYDGSSKFGPGNKWGFFPSVAVGWKVHNEPFMADFPVVNNLKLRASVGKTGNANFAGFLYETFFGAGFRYNGENGLAPLGVPNRNIQWETTKQVDVALEFGLFQDRIFGEIGFFSKKTNGLLTYAPIPGQLGFGQQIQNRADLQNLGYEVQIGGDIIRTPKVRWSSTFNYSRIKNEVTSLNGGYIFSGGGNGNIREGEPLGFIMGYVVEGIFQTADEITALNTQAQAGGGAFYQVEKTSPGDYKYKDISGPNGVPDGRITSDDRTIIGYIQPDYYGGWYNNINYKGFDFSFLFTYAAGNSKEWLTGETFHSGSSNVLRDQVYDAWTPENPDAEFPRVILDDPNDNRRTSTANVLKADYLKLKNVQLAYTFPEKMFSKAYITRAQVFVAASNIFSITNYPGLDAEAVTSERPVGNSTIDNGRDLEGYPFSRVISFGINIGF
ncbi:SusC/RagA family TonB-linked outer membrane protein [Rufibacter hautae]|uniref:SusC/RagA family TonB-linked outer membrane protein n=1 Tax=Rufibacter hautae TaxID=2595005 RepID=A0A5B6TFX4_9BACT|nr:SusC/RagA family TonB-linked outer membrane protein [Rufibacter hautae]KAA3438195.1 SusC/RagA family TonB-linked outer membrane protein [Rufibacter hautae]